MSITAPIWTNGLQTAMPVVYSANSLFMPTTDIGVETE